MSQLSTIDDQLITSNNAPWTDVGGMDHARCTALHNDLVDYCRVVDGRLERTAEAESGGATFFSTYGEGVEAVRPRPHPSLAVFLVAVRTPDAQFFILVDSMPGTSGDLIGLFDNFEADLQDEPPHFRTPILGPPTSGSQAPE